jgi:cytochrome c oxidase subunit 4
MRLETSHIIPYRTFIIVWIGLLVLTGLTIAVAQIDLGALNIWVALSIASCKSALVVAVFMHMKYEQRLFKLSLLATLVILAFFIGFAFVDVLYR